MNRAASLVLASALAACGRDAPVQPDAPDWTPIVDAGPDAPTVPYVERVSPLADATGVEGDVVVTAVFSEPMNPSSIDTDSVTITGPAGPVSGVVTYDAFERAVHVRPTNELTRLATYTVTIAATVSDVEGQSLASPYSWTFVVADRWWHPAHVVHAVANGGWTRVACAADGDILAVWQQLGAGGYELHAARREGASWSSPQRLDTVASPVVDFELAASPAGDAIVGWYQSSSGVWTRQYRAGVGWDSAVQLDDWGVGVSVAIDQAGDAMASWMNFNALEASRYTRTNGWSAAATISTQGTTGGASMGLTDAGDALVTWAQTDGDYHVWGRSFSMASGWSTPLQLGPDVASSDRMGLTRNGKAVVVWAEGGGSYDVVARHYTVAGGWEEPQLLRTDPVRATVGIPRLGLDDAGNALVVWAEQAPYRVVARVYDDAASTWSAPVNAPTIDRAEDPIVAVAPDGAGYAAWEERRDSGSDRQIVAARMENGALVTADVEDLDASEAYSVSLAACSGGTALIVWMEESGVYAAEFR